ncbi:hypothetical protein BH24DEI1_BH24DEI1_08800 [soil metagenome]
MKAQANTQAVGGSGPSSINKERRGRILATVLVVLTLLLAACTSTLQQAPATSPALLSDADIDAAALELATTTAEVTGTELGSLADGAESDLLEAEEEELSTQAVLPGASGYIAYVHFDGLTAKFQLWLANQSNDKKTLVYTGNRYINSVAVSLTGNILVFSMNTATGCCDIYRLIVSSNKLSNLTNSPALNHINVSMTADDKIIAWGGTHNGKHVVYIRTYERSGSSQSMLSASAQQTEPSISSDGKTIALMRFSSGKYRVMRYDRQKKTYLQVATSSNPLLHPSPSNNGKLAWLENRAHLGLTNRVRVKTIATGAITNALSTSSYIAHPHLASDGNFIVYDRYQNSKYNIFTRNLSTGKTARTVSASHWFDGAYWQK